MSNVIILRIAIAVFVIATGAGVGLYWLEEHRKTRDSSAVSSDVEASEVATVDTPERLPERQLPNHGRFQNRFEPRPSIRP